MKYLRTYEQMDPVLLMGLQIAGSVANGFIMYYVAKFLRKLKTNRLNKARYHRMFGRDVSSPSISSARRWSMYEDDNEIALHKDGLMDYITIDKRKKIFNFTGMFKVKLTDQEYNDLIESVNFIKDIDNTIDECLYDFTDIGYNAKALRIDFARKTFDVEITRPYTRIKFLEISNILDDVLYRITSQYNVKVSGECSQLIALTIHQLTANSIYYVTEYSNGIVELKNNDGMDVRTFKCNLSTDLKNMEKEKVGSSWDSSRSCFTHILRDRYKDPKVAEMDITMDSLIIPFIKK